MVKNDISDTIKVVFMGDAFVGKTSLLNRMVHNTFQQEYICTIGVEFACKNVQLDGNNYRFQFWDTAGQERFRSLSVVYYRNAFIACVCFDLSQSESMKNLQRYVQQVKDHGSVQQIFIIGCKKDLKTEVAVDAVIDLCERHGCQYAETSAKTGYQIEQLFLRMCEVVLNKGPSHYRRQSVQELRQEPKRKRLCC